MRGAGTILGALGTALCLAAPPAARAGPPGGEAVLALTAARLRAVPDDAGRRAAALQVAALTLTDDGDGGDPAARLPGWIRRAFLRWDTFDGSGYGLRPGGWERDGWFLGGELERLQGPQPLVIEPDEEPDSPRSRIAGEDARSLGAVLDLSEIPRLLVALGAGGGRRHLHAYLGWRVTLGGRASGG